MPSVRLMRLLRSGKTSSTNANTISQIPQSISKKLACGSVAPTGLSSNDEFFLWGLLALTFSQPEPTFDFYATPHFCLKRLGNISTDSKGGKSYALFREAISRLSAVRYQNERFYDPIRREHRSVSFGFFSYSLPIDPDSSRAWRIVWDPLFFEFCQAAGSQLAFDLEAYRDLDCGTRRLFLLLKKVFWRRKTSPAFDVRHLATNVIGFSENLETRTLKAKLKRCIGELIQRNMIAPPHGENSINGLFVKRRKGEYSIRFQRGPYFEKHSPQIGNSSAEESPLFDPLVAIGFERPAIEHILRRFKTEQIQIWSDVTLAAIERKGKRFFRRSPQAFFMDNIQKAVAGLRTPPDWFRELQKEEQRQMAEEGRRAREAKEPVAPKPSAAAKTVEPSTNENSELQQIVTEMFSQFRAAGQSMVEAKRNAERFATEHARRERSDQCEEPVPSAVRSLFLKHRFQATLSSLFTRYFENSTLPQPKCSREGSQIRNNRGELHRLISKKRRQKRHAKSTPSRKNVTPGPPQALQKRHASPTWG